MSIEGIFRSEEVGGKAEGSRYALEGVLDSSGDLPPGILIATYWIVERKRGVVRYLHRCPGLTL